MEISFLGLSADFGELGNLELERGGCCPLLWQFGCVNFPADFPCEGDFPEISLIVDQELGTASGGWDRTEETGKDVLEISSVIRR